MLMSLIKWLAIGLAVLAALLLIAGQAGLLQGTPPTHLGVAGGRLKPPSRTPNSVSSQAGLYAENPAQAAAAIAPLAWPGAPAAAMPTLAGVIASMPRAVLVEQRADYLYARFTSRLLGFVDDAEFWLDPTGHLIQVRSASRLGRKDFGVNRQRIDHIRAMLATAG